MHTVLQFLKWLFRAWPILVMLIMLFVHYVLIYYFSLNFSEVNKFASLLSQLVGGGFILYSIDSNIQTFNEKNFIAIFKDYLWTCPLIKRSVILQPQAGSVTSTGHRPKVIVGRNPQSIEEKLEYLQDQINEVINEIEYQSKELNAKIDRCSKEMKDQIQETKSDLESIESKIKNASFGGIKIQLFGVLLMVYGAFCGYFA